MRKTFILVIAIAIISISCSNKTEIAKEQTTFTNPILAGFYPDPSICGVDGDYYMITSTFAYFPGLPVFHSKDLVNWTQIGNVIDRPEQMDTKGADISRGLFAPAITYDDGLFYVVCTLIDKGGNFIVTAKNPAGPWSNPTWIPEIDGIDPSLYFDDNGKSYIVYNSVAPDNEQLYQGHRTIRMFELDKESLKLVGDEILLINGGTDLSKNPIWIEAPHIYKVDSLYYLICAEGGTRDWHSEVVFRSKNIEGPYISYENNPILTQRHLDINRKNPITSTGHADMIQTPNGDWWAVFLGCRSYAPNEEDLYNTGRETFLAPVVWKDGWPIINPDFEEVQYSYPMPITPAFPTKMKYSGNFEFVDNFESDSLGLNWMFLRTPSEKWYEIEDGVLSMELRSETCSGKQNPSFIGHRQQHIIGSAVTSLSFNALSENEKAGLIIFQNESHFYYLCKSTKDKKSVVELFKSTKTEELELLNSITINDDLNCYLKIDAKGKYYSFSYSSNNTDWKYVAENVDGKYLSTTVAGGFLGSLYGLYATSSGKPSSSKASYNSFLAINNDEVYRK